MSTNTINAAERLTNKIAMLPGVRSVDMLPGVRSVERYGSSPFDDPAQWLHGTVTIVIRTQDDRKHRIEMSNELAENTRVALDCVRQALSR